MQLNNYLTLFRVFAIFIISVHISLGQEICDNGIDDDGDMLIDLNDETECFCVDTFENVYLFNTVCEPDGFVVVATDDIANTEYQWYLNGIAIFDATDWTHFVPFPYDGTYVCHLTNSFGCRTTRPVTVNVEDYQINLTDTICINSTYEFAGSLLSSAGLYADYLTAQNGCDSTIYLNLHVEDCGDTIIANQKFINNLIRVGVDTNEDGTIQISEALAIDSLDISFKSGLSIPQFEMSSVFGINYFTNLKYLDVSKHKFLGFNVDSLTKLEHLNISSNNISDLALLHQPNLSYLNIHSTSVRTLVLADDSKLKHLFCSSCRIIDMDFTKYPALETLYFGATSPNIPINLSANTKLKKLTLRNSSTMELNVSHLEDLEHITLRQLYNLEEPVNLTQNVKLEKIVQTNMDLIEFDPSYFPLLKHLDLTSNSILNLDMSANPDLKKLIVSQNNNLLLDVSSNHKLEYFANESLQSDDLIVDLSNCYIMDSVILRSPDEILLKNGSIESYIEAPAFTVKYICVDEEQYDEVREMFEYTRINSYCYFTPPGENFTVQGTINYTPSNSSDCMINSYPVPMAKLKINDGQRSGYIILDQEEGYDVKVVAGETLIIPIIKNQQYYDISPDTLRVNFPDMADPLIQNFCITPKENIKDVAVHILPLAVARPGFDATYKIQIENNGTINESGTVILSYDDEMLSFNNSIPSPSNEQLGEIQWEYNELLPFQKTEIELSFLLNSPMSTPPLNGGDVLNFTLFAATPNDINTSDNTAILNQTAVNSFDPNDKQCLEGEVVSLPSLGNYLHYKIRFENTGDAYAQQVVIKDTIDITKFDINTLIPIDGSHPFYTRTRGENVVEFIFENIDLPFESGQNDGYLIFQIKTRTDLEFGDQLLNDAEIYFDYNHPIVTNEYITNYLDLDLDEDGFISSLDCDDRNPNINPDAEEIPNNTIDEDCDGADLLNSTKVLTNARFSIFPNPANEFIKILVDQSNNYTATLYDTNGRQILKSNNSPSLSVHHLLQGIYLLEIIDLDSAERIIERIVILN